MEKVSVFANRYLAQIPSHIKTSDYPLTKIDPSRLEGFQKLIPVFEGVSMPDIAFITKKFDTLNLFRGCNVGCMHCFRNAISPKSGRETILSEDFKRFIFGFKRLNDRLGFNVFNGTKYLNIADDSEPIGMYINGKENKLSLVNAMKLIYRQLGIPIRLTTSGWDTYMSRGTGYGPDFKTARSIAKLAKSEPDMVEKIQISVNPFLQKEGYSERMANTIYTFLDWFKLNKANIVYKHTKDDIEGVNDKAAKQIYENIYKILQKMSDSKLEAFPELRPDIVTQSTNDNWIDPVGYGRKFISQRKRLELDKKYAQETQDWDSKTKEEQRDILLNTARKCIDIDGSVYTVKPTNISYSAHPIEVTVPTKIKFNFINKEKPNSLYKESDFEL